MSVYAPPAMDRVIPCPKVPAEANTSELTEARRTPMAEKPTTEDEAAPANRAERRRRAKGKRLPPAQEIRRSTDPDASGRSRDQQRMSKRRR